MILLLASLAAAARGPEVPPPNQLLSWDAPLLSAPGTRVGMIVETRDTTPVAIEVWEGAAWVPVPETWREGRVAVHVVDFGRSISEVRFRSPDRARITRLDWDLLVPAGERRADRMPTAAGVLPTALTDIGVTARASWGARSTTCTTVEDDWYRMAIHHTAGTQTYGGTVQGAVQALQAYSMDSGDYCDIPYQFLVGYDGSLWEGRPYDYYSGATGGGNNDGNIAVSFLGCYHPTSCSTSHAVTSAMIEDGQLLVQTLVGLHAVPSDSDSIRGHRDWPGNSTACPGDWLYDRLDDLRTSIAPSYAASFYAQTFPYAADGAVELVLGEEEAGYIEMLNVGTATWQPGSTNLAVTPRESTSAVADEGWVSSMRPATVDAVTPPGEVGRFSFALQGNSVGETAQYFGLVEEWVTWFADDGGPRDDQLQVRVIVSAPPDEEDPDDTAIVDTAGPGPGSDRPDEGGPGALVGFDTLGGCGCASARGGGGTLLGLAGLLSIVRRRRRV